MEGHGSGRNKILVDRSNGQIMVIIGLTLVVFAKIAVQVISTLLFRIARGQILYTRSCLIFVRSHIASA